jgi:uncharacterized protein YjiS (DUF1127 family)
LKIMSTVSTRLASLSSELGQYLARRRDRKLLLQLDDRTLADISISRELLENGVKSWPWKLDADDHGVRLAATRIKSAVRELQGYTDGELADLGIARGGIFDAVLHGRPGIDGPTNDNAAAAKAA